MPEPALAPVSYQDLLLIIGQQQVEIFVLRSQLAQAQTPSTPETDPAL